MDNHPVLALAPAMERKPDVLIVGGGLSGPALALALAAGGITSVILDAEAPQRHADPDFDGRAYALSLSSRRMLEALGLWGPVASHAQAIARIKISDGRPGEGAAPWVLHFDSDEIDEGPMGHIVEDRHLRAALLAAVRQNDRISHRTAVRVVAQEAGPAAVRVILADGATCEGGILVGCDGRSSGTAARAGIGRLGWDYRQTSLVCAVAHARPHDGIAHQFFMPSGPLAILPLPGERCSIVWTEERARAEAILAMTPEAYLAVLRPRFGDFLGPISLAGQRYAYPLGLTLAERFTAPRVALCGDAAHGLHPIAGQGLNLGLRDVAALAEVLILARRRGEDIGAPDVLARYAGWRRVDTALLVAATDAVNRLFSNDNPLLRLGRDLGLGLVNRVPPLRRELIRAAAGVSGELPLLLRGKRI